ncbi:serine/threonine-protein phosphatase 6 regulatory ankyrin repeat subunit C-like [Haliotis rufescens]|uniref:serine/threonine-protein phosphatase 6 regulatory ankyrin repeat subunit C-like n=1 Tax=Haliotis rufescens TaxID=6454 RepID=UPI00201ED236|nr:serine/threonine-protein phosphatase 6 regulatory ankyrin repeat subunit C-like [Haliotis rufescens]
MMAVEKGWNISPLLTTGANVNSQNKLGETALHLVSDHMYEHAPINERQSNTEQLIAARADVNVQDKKGNTPLMTAVKKGWNISPLLTAGANVNSKNRLGETALHLVGDEHKGDWYGYALIKARQSNTEQLIAAGADVNVQDEEGNTPLMMAAMAGRNISPLLTARADVTSKNGLGKTALHLVCEHRYPLFGDSVTHKRVTEQLIAAGADVNVQDKDGNTPLMMAVKTERNISPLLTAGANVNSKNGLGKTALHLVSDHMYEHALINERQSNTEQLIAAGADVSAQDEDGNTPLHICVKNNDYRSVKALLGVLPSDVNIRNRNGKSALDLAEEAEEEFSGKDHNYRLVHRNILMILKGITQKQ